MLKERIKQGWTQFQEFNAFGRVFVFVGLCCLIAALAYLVGPDPTQLLSTEVDSYQKKVYRLFGKPGVVVFWVAFGIGFVWVGLLVGKNKMK